MNDEQTLTGKVESISKPKTGKDKNQKDYTSYYMTINGKTFSAYNPTFTLPIKDDEVEVKYVVNGDYNNINGLRILGPNDIVQTVEAPVVNPAEPELNNPIPTPPIEPQMPAIISTPTAAPAQPIPQVTNNNYNSENKDNASDVAQSLINAAATMVGSGAIEPGKFKSNLDVLIDAYKTTKQRLLE